MKVNFVYDKKDYKKFLIKSRLINNIVLFILGTIFYLFLSYNKISLLILPLFMIGLVIIIFILNIIFASLYIKANDMLNNPTYGKYTLEITQNKFSITVNKRKIDYKYKDIKKIKVTNKDLNLKMNKRIGTLTFEKIKFKESDFDKLVELFQKRTNL